MSMNDRCYCATDCPQKDCERNLKFHIPTGRNYSVAKFNEDSSDSTHETCKWKIKKEKN